MSDFQREDFLPPEDQCFASVGWCCQTLQITPRQLLVLMEAAGVRFVRMIDATGYIDGDGFRAVTKKAAEIHDEIKSVSTSHERN